MFPKGTDHTLSLGFHQDPLPSDLWTRSLRRLSLRT